VSTHDRTHYKSRIRDLGIDRKRPMRGVESSITGIVRRRVADASSCEGRPADTRRLRPSAGWPFLAVGRRLSPPLDDAHREELFPLSSRSETHRAKGSIERYPDLGFPTAVKECGEDRRAVERLAARDQSAVRAAIRGRYGWATAPISTGLIGGLTTHAGSSIGVRTPQRTQMIGSLGSSCE
jgi:hypothetical protein